MHTGISLFSAMLMHSFLAKNGFSRAGRLCYVHWVLTITVVQLAENHYWFDALGGTFLVLAARFVCHKWDHAVPRGRRRREEGNVPREGGQAGSRSCRRTRWQ